MRNAMTRKSTLRKASILIIATLFAGIALADSGFFKTSKHGSAAIGVYRDSDLPRGNCSQCHLEHDNEIPFDFALFAPNDNGLCQSSGCHEFQYQWPPGYYYWPYPGNVPDWYNSGHGSSVNPFPPGTTREVRLCLQCHNPHTSGDSLHGAFPSATSNLEEHGCYSYNGIPGQGCHGNNNANRPIGAVDIYSQLLKPSKHDVTFKTKIHSSDWSPNYPYGRESRATNSGFFSGNNRHVECVDCHNPHKSISGNHIPGENEIGGALLGIWGVEPTNNAGWTTPVIFDVVDFSSMQTAREYQLCFKCHSYFAFGNIPPTGYTDIAREFNPANASYHSIEDTIRTNSYTSPSPINGFRETMESPWDNGRHDQMACSDCHSSETVSDPKGPHGSNQPYILIGSPSAADISFCTKCHKASVYSPPVNPGTQETGSRFDRQTTGEGDASHYYHVVQRHFGCRQCHATRQNPPPATPERTTPYPTQVGSAHGTNTFPGLMNGANISDYSPGSCTPTCHGRENYTAGPE